MHPQSHLVVKSLRHVASLFAYACVLGWQDQRYTQAAENLGRRRRPGEGAHDGTTVGRAEEHDQQLQCGDTVTSPPRR